MSILWLFLLIIIILLAIASCFFLIAWLIKPPKRLSTPIYGTIPQQSKLPTPPTPAPAPAYAKSTSWGWGVAVGFLGVIVIFGLVVPALRTSAPLPQATAPKRELHQRVVKRDLKFMGGNGSFEQEGFIEVRKGGHAFFVTNDLPWRKDAKFHIAVCLRSQTTGTIWLTINGGRGGEKSYLVPASAEFGNAVFFDSGEVGHADYFNPGTNQIIVSAPDSDTIIQWVAIEMIYYE